MLVNNEATNLILHTTSIFFNSKLSNRVQQQIIYISGLSRRKQKQPGNAQPNETTRSSATICLTADAVEPDMDCNYNLLIAAFIYAVICTPNTLGERWCQVKNTGSIKNAGFVS